MKDKKNEEVGRRNSMIAWEECHVIRKLQLGARNNASKASTERKQSGKRPVI